MLKYKNNILGNGPKGRRSKKVLQVALLDVYHSPTDTGIFEVIADIDIWCFYIYILFR